MYTYDTRDIAKRVMETCAEDTARFSSRTPVDFNYYTIYSIFPHGIGGNTRGVRYYNIYIRSCSGPLEAYILYTYV